MAATFFPPPQVPQVPLVPLVQDGGKVNAAVH
jgi:hypothetical protein